MKLDYSDSEFDMVVTSNAPVYLEEAVRVLKPGGIILVAYSFGGEAFNKAKEEVNDLLNNNRLELELLKTSDKWVFILGRKEY
jgi:ubiquinone/menaquinone biosynthesis C-methylase UbiE